MTNLRIATVVATLAVAIVCGVTSNLVLVEMVGEVNEKLPEKERFLEAFWYPGKIRRLLARTYNSFRIAGSAWFGEYL